jgi:hypothetical protein
VIIIYKNVNIRGVLSEIPTKILVKKVKKMKDRPFPATNTMKEEDVVMSDTYARD